MKISTKIVNAVFNACEKYASIAWQTKNDGDNYPMLIILLLIALMVFALDKYVLNNFVTTEVLFITFSPFVLVFCQPMLYWIKNKYGAWRELRKLNEM